MTETAPLTASKTIAPLDGIEGQERALAHLRTALASRRLSHALAFVGRAGVGRGMTAQRLAAWLLADGNSRGAQAEWQSELRLMEEQAHPDFLSLAPDESMAKPEINVEAARKLVSFMQQTPSRSTWRVAVVEQAEKFNRQAANGILKILEEPPARATIILLVTDLEQVLPTIRSRVTAVAFQPLPTEVMAAIAQRQGLTLGDTALRASGGSLEIARQLSDPKAAESISHLQSAAVGRLSDDRLHSLVAWCAANSELALGQTLQALSQAARLSQNQAMADAYFQVMALEQRRQSYNLDAGATWLEIFALVKKCAKATAGR